MSFLAVFLRKNTGIRKVFPGKLRAAHHSPDSKEEISAVTDEVIYTG